MSEKKCAPVGGQAVIEGVMMKGSDYLATAVRRPDGDIVYRKKKIIKDKLGLFKTPFIRGVFILFETLVMGTKELTFSAVQSGDEEEEELTDFKLGLTLFASFAIGISFFFLLPSFVAELIAKNNSLWSNVVEGVIRLSLFVLYVYLISFSKDIRRVFQYHGAEHMSIYAYEKGEKLTVENAKKYDTLHPRCGTSFLITVMLISVIIFSFADISIIQTDSRLIKLLTRLVLRISFLPIVGGISYEFLKFSSSHLSNPIIKALAAPGLWLQKITTKKPDDSQLEVGLVALRVALGEENIENATEIHE